MRNPSLRQLEAFVAVIETGTVSAAAAALRISQPAASKLIRDLEADTQLALFERDSGRLVATDRGMRLYEEVTRIFGGVNQLARAVEGIRREEKGQILVGVMPGLGGAFLRRVLTKFRQTHPDVYIQVDTRSSQFLSEAILLRRLDVAITATPLNHPTVHSEVFPLPPMVCIMPKGHPLSALDVVTIDDLGDTPFIAFVSTTQTRLRLEQAITSTKRLNVVIEANQAQSVAEFVAGGFGVTIARPAFFETVAASKLDMRPFLPEVPDEFSVLRPVRGRNNMLVDSFVAAVRHASEDVVWPS